MFRLEQAVPDESKRLAASRPDGQQNYVYTPTADDLAMWNPNRPAQVRCAAALSSLLIIARLTCQEARCILQASCSWRLPQSYPLLDSPDPSNPVHGAQYLHPPPASRGALCLL